MNALGKWVNPPVEADGLDGLLSRRCLNRRMRQRVSASSLTRGAAVGDVQFGDVSVEGGGGMKHVARYGGEGVVLMK